MWLPTNVIQAVDEVASIYYIDVAATHRWNSHRGEGELRQLTGWTWVQKGGGEHRQGFKTMTVAYRDAWYALVAQRATPAMTKARLRVVRAA